ncbi:MAG: type 1 glutamine amidotransferase domain-containing protein [Pseudomonadota bacterium]
MKKPRILIVATSAAQMYNGEPTGVWLEELTTPYYAFKDSGAPVVLASVSGGVIPIDARSVSSAGENDASVERYLSDAAAQNALATTKAASDFTADDFDILFLPGGHGTMFDYPQSEALAALVEAFDRAGKVVAAVCHGPAGLVSAKTIDGAPLVADRTVAGFTNSEEHAVGLEDAVPFLLETRLAELGANYRSGPDFQPFAVRDRNLVTGQNPASATRTAELALDAFAATELA